MHAQLACMKFKPDKVRLKISVTQGFLWFEYCIQNVNLRLQDKYLRCGFN